MKEIRKDDDAWLQNAEVQTRIVEERGRWVVSLVFIDIKDIKCPNIEGQTMWFINSQCLLWKLGFTHRDLNIILLLTL